MAKHCFSSRVAFFQITVTEIGVDGFVAYGVDGLLLLSASAFRDRMVPFDNVTYRPRA